MAENSNETQLDRIERKIDENNRVTYKQWVRGLGIGIVIASAGFATYNVVVSIGLFIAGYLLIVLPIGSLKKH